jgi:hypothetical protein
MVNVGRNDLHSWKRWAEREGDYVGSKRRFNQRWL